VHDRHRATASARAIPLLTLETSGGLVPILTGVFVFDLLEGRTYAIAQRFEPVGGGLSF
jgi:hypothetical protein